MTATLKRLGDLAWQNAYLLLTITTLSWAGNAVASKAAVGEVSPFLLTMLRWIIVAAIILAIAWKDLVAAWPTLRARLLYVFAMGGIGFTAFNASFYVAA
ncbi:MAG: EamA family transporter, partial [Pseudomonadota bacterium]